MICIGLLTEKEIDEVLELERICFPDDPWGRLSFENELDNPLSVFLIAADEETEKIVGYGGVWMIYDSGNITNIAVHPDYRRGGIGRKLLRTLIDICREKRMSDITLEVRSTNDFAQRLYKSEGFEVCGLRKRYYRGVEDAIIMTKKLRG